MARGNRTDRRRATPIPNGTAITIAPVKGNHHATSITVSTPGGRPTTTAPTTTQCAMIDDKPTANLAKYHKANEKKNYLVQATGPRKRRAAPTNRKKLVTKAKDHESIQARDPIGCLRAEMERLQLMPWEELTFEQKRRLLMLWSRVSAQESAELDRAIASRGADSDARSTNNSVASTSDQNAYTPDGNGNTSYSTDVAMDGSDDGLVAVHVKEQSDASEAETAVTVPFMEEQHPVSIELGEYQVVCDDNNDDGDMPSLVGEQSPVTEDTDEPEATCNELAVINDLSSENVGHAQDEPVIVKKTIEPKVAEDDDLQCPSDKSISDKFDGTEHISEDVASEDDVDLDEQVQENVPKVEDQSAVVEELELEVVRDDHHSPADASNSDNMAVAELNTTRDDKIDMSEQFFENVEEAKDQSPASEKLIEPELAGNDDLHFSTDEATSDKDAVAEHISEDNELVELNTMGDDDICKNEQLSENIDKAQDQSTVVEDSVEPQVTCDENLSSTVDQPSVTEEPTQELTDEESSATEIPIQLSMDNQSSTAEELTAPKILEDNADKLEQLSEQVVGVEEQSTPTEDYSIEERISETNDTADDQEAATNELILSKMDADDIDIVVIVTPTTVRGLLTLPNATEFPPVLSRNEEQALIQRHVAQIVDKPTSKKQSKKDRKRAAQNGNPQVSNAQDEPKASEEQSQDEGGDDRSELILAVEVNAADEITPPENTESLSIISDDATIAKDTESAKDILEPRVTADDTDSPTDDQIESPIKDEMKSTDDDMESPKDEMISSTDDKTEISKIDETESSNVDKDSNVDNIGNAGDDSTTESRDRSDSRSSSQSLSSRTSSRSNDDRIHKVQHTFLGGVSLEDFLVQLDWDKSTVTATKLGICEAFGFLAEEDNKAIDRKYKPLNTGDYNSNLNLRRVKMGNISLFHFIRYINFDADGVTLIKEVGKAFRHFSKMSSDKMKKRAEIVARYLESESESDSDSVAYN